MEDGEAWRLRAAFAVGLPVGGEAETVEALHLGGDLAVVFLVSVRLEDVEVSRSEHVAERSGDAEVEDEDLSSEAASAVGFLEAVDVETLYSGDIVGLLVGVEVEDVEDAEVMCLGDAVDWHEGAEAEEGAVGFPEDAEIEEDVVVLLEDVYFESAAALQSEVSAVENVEARQAFELAFGSSGCSPDLDLSFFLQGSYSPDQEREPLLEMGLETGGAADCQMVRDCDQPATLEVLDDDMEARLLRVDFDSSQEFRFLQCLELDAKLALLVGEVLLHQADECCLALAGRWG